MQPLVVLMFSGVLFLVLGRAGVKPLRDPIVALRWALAVMFLFTASAHFVGPRADLVRMVPPVFPDPGLMVTLTGIAEIAGAIGLLIPRFAPAAATGLALLLVAMLPANVHAAAAGLSIAGRPATALVPRVLLQVLFLTAVLVAGWLPRRTAVRTGLT